MEKVNSNGQAGKVASGGGAKDLPTREEFDRVRQLANGGDQDAQSRLRQFLDEHEDICEQLGEMAGHARAALVQLISEGDFVVSEAIRRKVAQMRRDLAGAFPSPLELLGADRVVAAWLGLQWVESLCARAEGDPRSGSYWLRRQAQAAKLYDSAVKSLLLMRRLLPAEGQPVLKLVDRNGTAAEAAASNGRINGNGSAQLNGSGEAHLVTRQGSFNRVANLAANGRKPEPAPV